MTARYVKKSAGYPIFLRLVSFVSSERLTHWSSLVVALLRITNVAWGVIFIHCCLFSVLGFSRPCGFPSSEGQGERVK